MNPTPTLGGEAKEPLSYPSGALRQEPVAAVEALRTALRFYARGDHFDLSDSSEWDTVSGEPQNFWCDGAGTATVEDGSIAAMALRGTPLDWTADGGTPPEPIEGEAKPVAADEGSGSAVVYPPDGTVSPFTVINLGGGLVRMGDAVHDARLPALWFGKDGKGMGHEATMDRAAHDGETLAVVTFSNVDGLDVLLCVIHRIRSRFFPDAKALGEEGWISVDERLPEKFTEVLIAFRDCTLPATGQYTGNLSDSPEGWCYPAENHGDGFDWTVTHWMPLPATPKATGTVA